MSLGPMRPRFAANAMRFSHFKAAGTALVFQVVGWEVAFAGWDGCAGGKGRRGEWSDRINSTIRIIVRKKNIFTHRRGHFFGSFLFRDP